MRTIVRETLLKISRLGDIRPAAGVLVIVIFLISLTSGEPLNNDGILYIQAAREFTDSGLRAALRVHGWPFYSMLIAWLANLTPLSFEWAAYALNGAFLVIIVTTFISLLSEMGASRTVQLLGAIVILGLPRFNHYYPYIIRGFGFWAFSLLSLLFLIRYYRELRWVHAVSWGLFMTLAALFRIEGSVFVCLIPLVLLLRRETEFLPNVIHALKAYSFPLVAIGGLMLGLLLGNQTMDNIGGLSRIMEQMQNGVMLFGESLHDKGTLISEVVLDGIREKWGIRIITFGLIGICLYRLISTLGPLQAVLSGHAAFKRLAVMEGGAGKVLVAFIILSIVIPAIYTGQKFIISHRFFMLPSILLLLWTPFSLHYLLEKWLAKEGIKGSFLLYPLVFLTFIVMFVSAFVPPGGEEAYIVSAGKWLKHQATPKARIISNNDQIPYYANRELIRWHIFEGEPAPEWKPGDIVAVKADNDQLDKLMQDMTNLGLRPVRTFESQEEDELAVIFMVPTESPGPRSGDAEEK